MHRRASEVDMKKQIIVATLGIFMAAWFQIADAQQPGKVSRIGYVSSTGTAASDASFAALRQGLHDLGHIEGKNILFEYRGAQGKPDRIPVHMAELVQLKMDLLFCPNLPAIHAAREATKTIPIVMVSNVDPVELGIVDSFAHPGGNITGLTLQSLELSGEKAGTA